MKTILLVLALLAGSVAQAEPPATRPVQDGKVLVLPFEPIGAAPGYDWIGRAVQQNLVAELSNIPALRPTTQAASPADLQAALNAAREAGASSVIFGSYQIVNDELRITGQVIDAQTGQSRGGLKVTGGVRDVFGLEDAIANQARRAMPEVAAAQQQADQKIAAGDDPMLQQPRNQVQWSGPLLREEGPYVGSDLQYAVDTGSLGVSRTPYQDRSWYYTYDNGYYGGYPYGYGWPIVYYNTGCYSSHHRYYRNGCYSPSTVVLGLGGSHVVLTPKVGGGFDGIPANQNFTRGFSNTQAYVPMVPSAPRIALPPRGVQPPDTRQPLATFQRPSTVQVQRSAAAPAPRSAAIHASGR